MNTENPSRTQEQEITELYSRIGDYAELTEEIAREASRAFRIVREKSSRERDQVLIALADLLCEPDSIIRIGQANEKDLENGRENGLSDALLDRLKLDDNRIRALAESVRDIARLPDPVGEIISGETLSNQIDLVKKRVPLGVIFTVYESRPNVTIDVGALCIKSGNVAILRGGKEALETNLALHSVFEKALESQGFPLRSVQITSDTDRALMLSLLKRDDRINLVVPRGGSALIQFVSRHSTIPVVKHDKGVCNLYIGPSAPLDQALEIAINSKLQRPSVCNAIENLILHKDFPEAKNLLEGLMNAGAELLGCDRTVNLFSSVRLIEDPEKEYDTEYLDNRLSVKIVDHFQDMLDFIYKYSSGHSEAIVSNDHSEVSEFLRSVDSAALMVNCSTRFHDGGQMGMGAEVGISTQRLHVRGPMGLRDLTTTTYILQGNGQVRN